MDDSPGPNAGLLSAVLLAGGRGRRLGGTDKARMEHRGRPQLVSWTEAIGRRRIPCVVVGPDHLAELLPAGVLLVREDPPFSGPAAAVCAGIRALRSAPGRPEPRGYLVASVDTLDPDAVVAWLLGQVGDDLVTTVPHDANGRLQWLPSILAAVALHARLEALTEGEERDRSLRWLFALDDQPVAHPMLPEGMGVDVDTPAEARTHGVVSPREGA